MSPRLLRPQQRQIVHGKPVSLPPHPRLLKLGAAFVRLPAMTRLLDCIELDPRQRATASVIWLHGLGADGNDFVPVAPALELPPSLAVRFVFPHAPMRAVTINAGMRMRAWYDILGIDRAMREDGAGVRESQVQLEALIQKEKDGGIPASRIVLAGFSQGGAIALQAGLRHAEKLAGIMALSTYLPLRDSLAGEAAAANCDVPIFMAHGTLDYMLPLQLGELSRDQLKGAGYPVEWHQYEMAHQVCPEEIRDIGTWLQRVLD